MIRVLHVVFAAIAMTDIVLSTEGPDESVSAAAKSTYDLSVSRTSGAGDSAALNAIFAESHIDRTWLSEASFSRMPPRERFESLAQQVLPQPGRPTFRLNGRFVSNRHDEMDANPRFTCGVDIMCPAIELIDAARQCGRLGQLAEQIEGTATPEVLQQYQKAALIFLVHVARNDIPEARTAFDRVMDSALKLDRDTANARWPAVLMLRAAFPHQELRRTVTEFFFSVHFNLNAYVPDPELDVLNDHLSALSAMAAVADDASTPTIESADSPQWIDPGRPTSSWCAFSYSDAACYALGRPMVQWYVTGHRAEKLSGHEIDYLMFRSPLRGNYEIECDFTSGSGESIGFMLAGTHLSPNADGTGLSLGNARKHFRKQSFDVPLTKLQKWSRYRAVCRDGILTQYINGLPVSVQPSGPDDDPWFAVRSWRRSEGQVRDLRIVGHPRIPEEVLLCSKAELDGWTPYFEEGFGTSGNWSGVTTDNGRAEIRGQRRPDLAGMSVEKLLRYWRPLLEDGTLTLEFFYQSGEFEVHPALDRTAFLLSPAGIRLHEITSRQHELSSLDPENMTDRPDERRGPEQLPFINAAWNRLRLDLRESLLQIFLNDVLICEHQLTTQPPPIFGLFHFCDRSGVRVRNVLWRGDWPKQLPPISEQTLADQSFREIERRIASLPKVLQHRFQSAADDDLFDTTAVESGLSSVSTGLAAKHSGGGTLEVPVSLQVIGDFDIVAEFENLDINMPIPRWQAGIGLRLKFDDELSHRCSLFRGVARNPDTRRVSFYLSSDRPDESRRLSGSYLVEESDSGRLRIARVNSTLCGFYASGDSPHYRRIAELPIPKDPLLVRGLTLELSGADDVRLSAVWKSLQIRADDIVRLSIDEKESAALSRKLEKLRENSSSRISDLSDPTRHTVLTQRTSRDGRILSNASGLRAIAAGSDLVSSASLTFALPPARAIDLQTDFQIHQFDAPASPERHGEITFRFFLTRGPGAQHSDPHEASLLLRQNGNGSRELIARVVRRSSGEREFVPIRAIPVDEPDQLRMALIDDRLLFLYSEAGADESKVIAEYAVSNSVFAESASLTVNAVEKDRATDVTFRRLDAWYQDSSVQEPIDD
ncbi:MAG: DUF1583 domain-containing protein [Planctomycetaceae bacterium]|nr:DUF1583 domain-containing protein [Planctomycetaceae bacterium]